MPLFISEGKKYVTEGQICKYLQCAIIAMRNVKAWQCVSTFVTVTINDTNRREDYDSKYVCIRTIGKNLHIAC